MGMSFWSARAALILVWKVFVQRANGSDFFNKTINISDPDIVFSSGDWIIELNSTRNLTVTTTDKKGATVSFNFTGTQIYAIADNRIDDVGNSTFVGANYTIDSGTPITQTVNLTNQGNDTIVFASPQLPYQNHSFLITVLDGIPFYDLSKFNITTSDSPPPTPSTNTSTTQSKETPTQSSPSTDWSGATSKHGVSKGLIAGVVVGILLLITLFTLCFYLSRWRRRQRQIYKARRAQRGNVPTYTSPPLTPFTGRSPPMSPKSQGGKRLDREFYSPTSTLVESSSPPSGVASMLRRPSTSHTSNSSHIHNPWPIPVETAAMNAIEDGQSILPEVKPSGRFSRSKENLGVFKPKVKKEKKPNPYPDFFQF